MLFRQYGVSDSEDSLALRVVRWTRDRLLPASNWSSGNSINSVSSLQARSSERWLVLRSGRHFLAFVDCGNGASFSWPWLELWLWSLWWRVKWHAPNSSEDGPSLWGQRAVCTGPGCPLPASSKPSKYLHSICFGCFTPKYDNRASAFGSAT